MSLGLQSQYSVYTSPWEDARAVHYHSRHQRRYVECLPRRGTSHEDTHTGVSNLWGPHRLLIPGIRQIRQAFTGSCPSSLCPSSLSSGADIISVRVEFASFLIATHRGLAFCLSNKVCSWIGDPLTDSDLVAKLMYSRLCAAKCQ